MRANAQSNVPNGTDTNQQYYFYNYNFVFIDFVDVFSTRSLLHLIRQKRNGNPKYVYCRDSRNTCTMTTIQFSVVPFFLSFRID